METARCGICLVFGHDDNQCPKRVVSESGANLGANLRRQNGPSHIQNGVAQNDGFQVVQTVILKVSNMLGQQVLNLRHFCIVLFLYPVGLELQRSMVVRKKWGHDFEKLYHKYGLKF